MNEDSLSTDVLVIGGGVAALRAAIAAREAGADVTMCCKGVIGRSGNTVVSTADMSAYVSDLSSDDSEDTFAADTLQAGASLADESLVRILAERSGHAVLDLQRLGVPLLHDGEVIDRTRAAGHSRARTYRANAPSLAANKGLALSVPLAERARAIGVRCLDRTPAVELTGTEMRAANSARVCGAVAVDFDADRALVIQAGAVIVGAGGASHLFARTNGTTDASGDVLVQAMHLGAKLRDMEFIQWHPTRLDEPVPMFLTNGLLADGAIFRDAGGRPFMADYDKRADLAPRDILAKAIYTEARAGRGLGTAVYLDCSLIPEERIALRHGHLAETLRKHGVDFPRQWLVVSPATHFLMGGIAIDTNACSSIQGLYAVGESAGGLHGANRLGGNAFSEGLVFGTIAGQHAASLAAREGRVTLSAGTGDIVRASIDRPSDDPKTALSTMWHALRQEMWQDASVVRDATGLARATKLIAELTEETTRLRGRGPREAARILDLRAGLQCAAAIVASATYREESRGAHWRSDFPDTSEAWFGSVWVTWPTSQQHPTLQFKRLNPRPPSL